MIEEVFIKFKKLVPEAVIPSYAHDGDVGMDMTAVSVEYDVDKDMYIYGCFYVWIWSILSAISGIKKWIKQERYGG